MVHFLRNLKWQCSLLPYKVCYHLDRRKYKGNLKKKAVKDIMENNDESPFKKTQLKNGVKGEE